MKFLLKARACLKSIEDDDPASRSLRKPWDIGAGASFLGSGSLAASMAADIVSSR